MDSYYDDNGDERHNSPCDGIIYNFKEGWICAKCKEDGDWPWLSASTVPTGSMASASERTLRKPQGALPGANTEERNTLSIRGPKCLPYTSTVEGLALSTVDGGFDGNRH